MADVAFVVTTVAVPTTARASAPWHGKHSPKYARPEPCAEARIAS